MRIRLTTQARDDLRDIWTHIHISGAGPYTADLMLRDLDRRIRRLAEFPLRGVARSDLGFDARMFVVKRWVVLYRVLPSEVVISRVVDGARDLSHTPINPDDEP